MTPRQGSIGFDVRNGHADTLAARQSVLNGRLIAYLARRFGNYRLICSGRASFLFLIVLVWACATLPNLSVRSFIYEEGTNAEIAKDVLAHGHFLQPIVYEVIWHG